MSSKEKILSRISDALKNKSELRTYNSSVTDEIKESLKTITPADNGALWEQFKIELEKIAGEYKPLKTLDEAVKFIYDLLTGMKVKAVGIDESKIAAGIMDKLIEKNVAVVRASSLNCPERKKIISEMNCAVVGPSFAVADIGSLVFTMDDAKTSYPHFLCDNTIAVIKRENITANQFELFEKIDEEKANNMFFVTGPSRTADIEKVLVLGAHGPRRLIVITIE